LKDYSDRLFSLAGLFQATHLVNSVARTGMASQDDLNSCLHSLFVFDPEHTLQVYGGLKGLRSGIRLADEILCQLELGQHSDVIRYSQQLVNLEQMLQGAPEVMREIGAELSRIQQHYALSENREGIQDPGCERELGQLYEATLSQFEPRIQVMGRRGNLDNAEVKQRIRALLLAGFRSAVLWRQVGGRRWQLFFRRGLYRQAVRASQHLLSAY